LFARKVGIQRLRYRCPERVQHAWVLLFPGRPFELPVKALWAATRELRHRLNPERLEVTLDVRAN
jgi:hypothetical protein